MQTFNFWIPLLIPLISLAAAVSALFIKEKNSSFRTALTITSAIVKLFLIAWVMVGVRHGEVYEFKFPVYFEFEIILHLDPLSLLFVALSSVLWFIATIYSIEYLKQTENQNRFFGFFNLCVCSTTFIAVAGNLFTFFIFYELLTVATYPLVVHRQTKEALSAGRVYLSYTILGGSLILFAMVWLTTIVGSTDFIERGILSNVSASFHPQLIAIFLLFLVGFGIKTALVPLHGWLPLAMVAPAPVSALLHAVAVVKAGAFGLVRVIYDVYGIEFCRSLGLLNVVLAMASFTIIYGSLRALAQDDLKRRLAYSTVSQVSYIILGVATASVTASIGGLTHLVYQGVMKITLFFCAGAFDHECGIKKISQMNGLGHKMPWSAAAFTVGAFGMIGIPPMAGFISKWYLSLGALEANQPWIVAVLMLSSLLNAMYFLPIIYRMWFAGDLLEAVNTQKRTPALLTLPPVVTAVLTILMGILPMTTLSPLKWTIFIALREYGQ